MSGSERAEPGKETPLSLLLVQILRECGDELRPSAESRSRAWGRIESALGRAQEKRPWTLDSWLRVHKRWVSTIACILIAATALPVLFESINAPEWQTVTLKGGGEYRIELQRRNEFVAGLQSRGVGYQSAPEFGVGALLIEAKERAKLEPAFCDFWRLPTANDMPLIVRFE